MTATEMRSYVEASPFQRFVIHLADGRHIPVNHREFIFMSPSGRMIHVYEDDDTLHVIDLYLVTGIELKPGRNSQRKSRKE